MYLKIYFSLCWSCLFHLYWHCFFSYWTRFVLLSKCIQIMENSMAMHVYAKNIYIWDPSCILEIPPHSQTHVLDQTYNAGNPVSVPLGLWQWHSMYVCQSLSDLAPVCLSVCFNTICHCRLCACLSVWPSICSIRQSILFVFDSWCVTLYVCLSDVIQVQCARAESPGVTIRFIFFFLPLPFLQSLDTLQSVFSGNAHVHAKSHAMWAWVQVCICAH